MGSKLFVGSLSWNTTDVSLKAAFEAHGPVREARVIMDRDTGRSRGFGFVTFENEADAKTAVSKMDGASLDGRNIRVNEAEERSGGRGRPGGNSRGNYNRGAGRRGPPEVHTRGRAPGPRRDGPRRDGPRRDGPGGDRGARPPGRRENDRGGRGGPPRSGGGGFRGGGQNRFPGGGGRGGFSAPTEAAESWEEDRTKRAEPRSKKKKVKNPRGDNEDFRPRSENRRSKRESGRSWRDYTSDDDYEDFE